MTAPDYATAIRARRDALMVEIDDLISEAAENLALARQRPKQPATSAGRVSELLEDAADKLVHALRLSDQAVLLEDLLK